MTISEVKLTKSNRNTWYARVCVAEKLFYYSYPLMIPNLPGKRTRDQFEVQFKVIQTFSAINIKKEFIKWVEIVK